MGSRTLYLVRHGALTVDERERYVGQLDAPLSSEGIVQAQALHDRCQRAAISRIYCSDLPRSRQTAEIIAKDRKIKIVPRWDLREISLGLWEGCARADIARRYPEEFRARGEDIEHYRPLGGESFADCRVRVVAALDEILESCAGDILVVGHAGVNRLILAEALDISVANIFKIGQDHGCLNVLECRSAGYRVQLLNFTPRDAAIGADRSWLASEAMPVG